MCLFFLFLCFVTLIVFGFFFFKQKTAYELRISDWSSDVCSSDLAQDQLDFIEQEKLRELFAQRCLGGHPTGIDTPIFIIECEGDCHSKSGSFAIDEKWFHSLGESLAFLAADFPILEKNDFGGPSGKLIRSTPDPEDDKILLWEVLPTGHRKVVWGFFGWHHSSSSDIYACGQSSLPEIGRASCRERVCQYV